MVADLQHYSLGYIIFFFLLLFFSVFIVYPNIYDEKYVVDINDISFEQAEEFIAQQELSGSVEEEKNTITFLFSSIDEQLDAYDKIKKQFPTSHASLNIRSQAPDLWQNLGIEPLKLGLDLRGGVHFVLEVDLDEALETYKEERIFDVKRQLEQLGYNIRFSKVNVFTTELICESQDDFNKVFAHLNRRFFLLVRK
jgi:preprotein translocase subunit SecD